MEKIYAAPINGECYAVFVGDKKLTLPLSESDAKKIVDRYNGFEELETENLQLVGGITVLQIENSSAAKQIEIIGTRVANLEAENKRLALQNEVLSAAFANSSEKEKGLRTAIDGLKGLLGTEQDATTQYFKVKVLEAEKDELLDFLENVAFPPE